MLAHLLTFVVFLGVTLGTNPPPVIGPPAPTPPLTLPPHDGGGNGTLYMDNDMILTAEQVEMLFHRDVHGRVKRKAWKGDKFRWTDNTVPYYFNGDDYTDVQKKEIRESMDVFEKETCLKFRPATAQDKNKVRFKQGQGCNSQLGMVGGSQDLNLDANGCRWKGLYWHEIGHAIGLVHEHQLPERSKYIQINWNNVNMGFSSAFSTYKDSELLRFGVPYDITSIMHYETSAFSQTGGQTVLLREKEKEHWVGRVFWSQMSFADVMIINRMYKCAANCPKIECEGGFINKECECITPQSYFDSHCINEHDNEEECYDRAHQGDCDRDYGFMNFKCRKACDRCARYGMEHLLKKGDCFNLYFDDARCDAWAAAGDCEKYPSWMKRQCQKSCGTCNSEWGNCANMHTSDSDCDTFKGRGECDANPEWMKNKCSDSCGTCGYITRGKCENDHPNEDECFKWSRAGQCVDDDLTRAFWMRKNCAASCNSCGFGKGKCDNKWDDFKCDKAAYEGKCITDPFEVRKNCEKSCNTCNFQVRGNCKNIHDRDDSCDYWADTGGCELNPGWNKFFCARSCNTCNTPSDMSRNCQDIADAVQCKKWYRTGQCDSNAGFVRYNCAKTCKSCHLLTTDKICADVTGDYMCKSWKEKGECEKNEYWMAKNCRLTCGKCEAGERVVREPERPKCENIRTDKECDDFAVRGECDNTSIWMLQYCSKSCNAEECGHDLTRARTEYEGETSDDFIGDRKCVNNADDSDCESWATSGQCEKNGSYMESNCFKSCHKERCANKGTGGRECTDEDKSCKVWAQTGHCERNPEALLASCNYYCDPKCDGYVSKGHVGGELKCTDEDENCKNWADTGHCERNPGAMMESCSKYCDPRCNGKCVNKHENCQMWAETGQCERGPGYMLKNCAKSCLPECKDGKSKPVEKANCVNQRNECDSWATGGHCQINETVMKICPKSCGVC